MSAAATALSDRSLYDRGLRTAAACWARFAAARGDAEVARLPGAVAAIFPSGPERGIYNNAILERGLGPAESEMAIAAVAESYAAAGIAAYAAWTHESDEAQIAALRRRGYRHVETTRAMALVLEHIDPAPPVVEARRPAWPDYVRGLEAHGIPPGLLTGVDGAPFEPLAIADLATALAFDHDGDCGIFNVGTVPFARRQGLGTAITTLQLHAAKQRGCATASLQATPMAERMYAAAGFRDLGRILEFAPSGVDVGA